MPNLFSFPVCTHLLLAHDAPVKVKNINGWSPLAEAISYGDRQTSKTIQTFIFWRSIYTNIIFLVCSLLKKLKLQAKEQIEERRPNLGKVVSVIKLSILNINDFRGKFDHEFTRY